MKQQSAPWLHKLILSHHHYHLFWKLQYLPCSARDRHLPRYEVSPHIHEQCPFILQTKWFHVIYTLFFQGFLPLPLIWSKIYEFDMLDVSSLSIQIKLDTLLDYDWLRIQCWNMVVCLYSIFCLYLHFQIFVLDFGSEMYVWTGKLIAIDVRKKNRFFGPGTLEQRIRLQNINSQPSLSITT